MKVTGLICSKCGFKNLIGEKYCSECGASLTEQPPKSISQEEETKKDTVTCPRCNYSTDAHKKYCGQCGYPLKSVVKDGQRMPQTSDLIETAKKGYPSSILPAGTTLQDRYKITKLIGQGGMGAIYIADDTRFSNRVCVIKEMLDNFTDFEQRDLAVKNFLREADVLASLHYHGIPEVYDRFSEGNRHYLVMEYINGGDLEQKLEQREEPFNEKNVLNWASQICEILNYLHSQEPPVIYRDMKPANLMLTKEGKIYIVDFGIARFFNPTKKGTMIGTQGYAPPEQYRGLIEPRSDIYALGATMHHLLTGRDPQDEAPFSFPPVRKLNPNISVPAERLIAKSLEKDVSDRYESANDMLKGILKVTSNNPDFVKICPHCNNKVSMTKQFCPYCNEYIASLNIKGSKNNFFEGIFTTQVLLVISGVSVLLNVILIFLLLSK